MADRSHTLPPAECNLSTNPAGPDRRIGLARTSSILHFPQLFPFLVLGRVSRTWYVAACTALPFFCICIGRACLLQGCHWSSEGLGGLVDASTRKRRHVSTTHHGEFKALLQMQDDGCKLMSQRRVCKIFSHGCYRTSNHPTWIRPRTHHLNQIESQHRWFRPSSSATRRRCSA